MIQMTILIALLVFLSVFTLIQLERLKADLVMAKKAISPSAKKAEQLMFPKTKWGAELTTEVRALSRRVNALISAGELAKAPLFEGDKKESAASAAIALTQRLYETYRCQFAAILVEEPGDTLSVHIEGMVHQRLTSALKLVTKGEILTREPGVVANLEVRGLPCGGYNLEAFGVAHLVALPLEIKSEHGGRFSIVLGYRKGRAPTDLEIGSFAKLKSLLKRELEASLTVESAFKKAAEAQNSEQQKDKVISYMSHDIRTPLNNIKAILELIKTEIESGEHQDLLRVAQANCVSLREIVEDILDFAKHREGKLTANRVPTNLSALVTEVVDTFQITAKLKGVNLLIEMKDGAQATTLCCPRQVRRVLSNLVGNAVKYTDSGTVTVRLREQSQNVVITVTDTGIGMTKSELEMLFTPFTRFSHDREGTGLGLSLTKVLVGLNEGEISVNSQKNKGSEFRLSFNAICCDMPEQPRSRKRILLVDDDPDLVESLGRLLKARGWEVLTATSVRVAKKIIERERPEVVLTDYNMPDGGGLEVERVVTEADYGARLKFLTGSVTEEIAKRRKGSMLLKPVAPEELLQAIA